MKLFLWILSQIYLFVINLRNSKYDRYSPQDFGFPVISVGGIRAGGSGKTPICDKIIQEIEELGKIPVLFSRGYKRKSRKTEIISPDEKTSWEIVGDEPLMLKTRQKSLWLAIDADRNRTAKKLLERSDIDKKNIVGIMDDGFQCRSFKRNLDIVVITPNDLQDKMLPLGRLREPVKSLERADIIVSQTPIPTPKNLVVEFVANEFVNVVSGEKKTNFDEDFLCFCGIARPERFVASIKKLTGKEPKYVFFPDHHKFCDKDYAMLNSAPQAALATTQKDFMRLDEEKTEKLQNLWYLSYNVVMDIVNSNFLKDKIKEVVGR
ncbi:MAG: tetraacyldisaccharide 4'-kinase [Chitinivibrionia bacterium]|nr:tetraacyldisaccharide 4'-kinase [Chitinivibrionia bacterium]